MVTIYYHSQDTDGKTSGALAMMQYTDATVLPLNYNQEINCVDDEIIFIDITPSIIWLLNNTNKHISIYDHHQQAYNNIQQLKLTNIDYIFDNNYCGASIFYRSHANLHNEYIDEFLVYVDMYDTGKVCGATNKDDIFSFSEYMYRKTVNDIKWIIINKFNISNIIDEGNIIRLGRLHIIKAQYNNGKPIDIHGTKWYACQGLPSYYLVEMIEKDYQGLLTYYKSLNNEYKISLRSNTLDCTEYIKYINKDGGGHKSAAGCLRPITTAASTTLTHHH